MANLPLWKETVGFRPSHTPAITAVAIAVVSAGGGVHILGGTSVPMPAGVLLLLAAGGLGIWGIQRIMNSPTALLLDEKGIHASRLIAWADIVDTAIDTEMTPEHGTRRVAKILLRNLVTDIVALSGLSSDPDTVYLAIVFRVEDYRRTRGK